MSIIRTTAIICLTFLISAVLFIYYGSIENRYKLVKSDNGLYIFDKNSSVTNYCDKFNCRGLSAGMIIPHRYEGYHGQYPYAGQIPGVPIMPYNQFNPAAGNMTYLPVQSNQAYILQPVPQPMQPMAHPKMPHPQPVMRPPAPKPTAPAPIVAPIVLPAPVPLEPVPVAPAEFDEDMGLALPAASPSLAAPTAAAPEAVEEIPVQEGADLGALPEGGLPADENAGGFEEAPAV